MVFPSKFVNIICFDSSHLAYPPLVLYLRRVSGSCSDIIITILAILINLAILTILAISTLLVPPSSRVAPERWPLKLSSDYSQTAFSWVHPPL